MIFLWGLCSFGDLDMFITFLGRFLLFWGDCDKFISFWGRLFFFVLGDYDILVGIVSFCFEGIMICSYTFGGRLWFSCGDKVSLFLGRLFSWGDYDILLGAICLRGLWGDYDFLPFIPVYTSVCPHLPQYGRVWRGWPHLLCVVSLSSSSRVLWAGPRVWVASKEGREDLGLLIELGKQLWGFIG